MEIVRIPQRYAQQLSRLKNEEQLWVFQSLFRLSFGENIQLVDSFAGDVLAQIWRESVLMEKKNVKNAEYVGGECLATNTAFTPHLHRTLKESKVKENKVKQTTAKKKCEGGEVFKKLEKWLKGMESINSPKGYAKTLFQKYDEKVISKVLKDCACVSLSKFTELAEHHSK